MYKLSYTEIVDDDPKSARSDEWEAFNRSIELMKEAEKDGLDSKSAIKAVHVTTVLWTWFLEDLAKPQNQLPKELRAQIISVGLWVLKEAESVRSKRSKSFKGLINVSEAIQKGLK